MILTENKPGGDLIDDKPVTLLHQSPKFWIWLWLCIIIKVMTINMDYDLSQAAVL